MSWLKRSRPAYAVDGVEPDHHSDGWDIYNGTTLAGRPVVAEAVARLPQDAALEHLLHSLSVGTPDGEEWSLTFGDEALILFDLSYPGTDLFEEVLAAADFTGSVERADREVFVFTTTEPFTADVALAHAIDTCGETFRRLNTPSA